jgi:CheY-like chemotaxis protein
MTAPLTETTPRILIVDDNPAIHEDFRKIFELLACPATDFDLAESAFFGMEMPPEQSVGFEFDAAHQGQEALEMVRQALEEKKPYAMAFMDVRMPPGWDGVETIVKIWAEYPDLQVVLCTAYSDYSWVQLIEKLGHSDRLVILKKPFDNIEVVQLAHMLTMKWQLTQLARLQWKELEKRIDERTLDLEQAYFQLQKLSQRSGKPAGQLKTGDKTQTPGF